METSNSVWMRATAERIYPLAVEVERWPELLPHYRWVTVLEREGNRKLVEMAARRDWIPVSWQAVQTLQPDVPLIRFRHVRGVTTGMEVEWRFEPKDGGTLVTIHHALDLRWPLIGPWAAENVIGPHFVAHIAGQTLRCIKQLVEAGE
jgi:ribosome-associated toxin RatA of RatAB toxin-antitoxin module